MPAEWEKHSRTLMEWPVRASLIYPDNYEEVCGGYAAAARAAARFEPVTMVVRPEDLPDAGRFCGGGVDLLPLPHDDAWMRDNGPTFVRGPGGLCGVSWRFNAWGEKYAPYALDDALAGRVLGHFGVPRLDAPIVLEGGSIHVDGEGTLLTTEQCLLNKNRNPSLSREEIEAVLRRFLGVTKIIWLRRGLDGDETDGHVDNVACFSAPGRVLLQVCRDKNDPNYAITRENLEILRGAEDARERRLRVDEILQPPARFYRGTRLTLSYLNFYLVNGGLLLPVFGGEAAETDRRAAEALARAFPGREIARVNGIPLVREGGNVHCVTQQMPAA